MTDERRVTIDLGYSDWTVDELHDYFAAVGANAIVAAAKIDDALNADFRALILANMGDDDEPPEELVAVPGWQPLNLLGVDPFMVLGFAWIPAKRERPDLTFTEYKHELKASELMDAYVDAVLAGLPAAEEAEAAAEDTAPLAEASPTPEPTSPNSGTKSSSATSSSNRSRKSAKSGTSSSKR